MSDIAIRVENLSKRYRIGTRQRGYKTIRESIADALTSPFLRWRDRRRTTIDGIPGHPSSVLGPSNPQSAIRTSQSIYIWALKDVSFEVKQGEVVGIIGRHGAGKSTLLKILSRITKPTEGRAVVSGRVGSLLEVGTGFHPELTGRENIYLNGAILGMKKAEIERKFDEMVAFAEVEKFIDTPVKHYSSGMYVRLAFAVAAHLEPEVLMVDEVLAVGDAAFQQKCLGKMSEVTRQGRTILFVSHNMQAVQSLCENVLSLDSGQVVSSGPSRTVVAEYLAASSGVGSQVAWPPGSAPGDGQLRLTAVRVASACGPAGGLYSSKDNLIVELQFHTSALQSSLCVGFDLMAAGGAILLRSYQTDSLPERWPPLRLGENTWYCTIPAGLLNAGVYHLCPRIGLHNISWIVHLDAVVQFEIVLDHGVSPFWNVLTDRNRPGMIAPILPWGCRSAT